MGKSKSYCERRKRKKVKGKNQKLNMQPSQNSANDLFELKPLRVKIKRLKLPIITNDTHGNNNTNNNNSEQQNNNVQPDEKILTHQENENKIELNNASIVIDIVPQKFKFIWRLHKKRICVAKRKIIFRKISGKKRQDLMLTKQQQDKRCTNLAENKEVDDDGDDNSDDDDNDDNSDDEDNDDNNSDDEDNDDDADVDDLVRKVNVHNEASTNVSAASHVGIKLSPKTSLASPELKQIKAQENILSKIEPDKKMLYEAKTELHDDNDFDENTIDANIDIDDGNHDDGFNSGNVKTNISYNENDTQSENFENTAASSTLSNSNANFQFGAILKQPILHAIKWRKPIVKIPPAIKTENRNFEETSNIGENIEISEQQTPNEATKVQHTNTHMEPFVQVKYESLFRRRESKKSRLRRASISTNIPASIKRTKRRRKSRPILEPNIRYNALSTTRIHNRRASLITLKEKSFLNGNRRHIKSMWTYCKSGHVHLRRITQKSQLIRNFCSRHVRSLDLALSLLEITNRENHSWLTRLPKLYKEPSNTIKSRKINQQHFGKNDQQKSTDAINICIRRQKQRETTSTASTVRCENFLHGQKNITNVGVKMESTVKCAKGEPPMRLRRQPRKTEALVMRDLKRNVEDDDDADDAPVNIENFAAKQCKKTQNVRNEIKVRDDLFYSPTKAAKMFESQNSIKTISPPFQFTFKQHAPITTFNLDPNQYLFCAMILAEKIVNNEEEIKAPQSVMKRRITRQTAKLQIHNTPTSQDNEIVLQLNESLIKPKPNRGYKRVGSKTHEPIKNKMTKSGAKYKKRRKRTAGKKKPWTSCKRKRVIKIANNAEQMKCQPIRRSLRKLNQQNTYLSNRNNSTEMSAGEAPVTPNNRRFSEQKRDESFGDVAVNVSNGVKVKKSAARPTKKIKGNRCIPNRDDVPNALHSNFSVLIA